MTSLIIGPSNAGKSTYIDQAGISPVFFAYQLADGDVPTEGAIHYNLLHHALELDRSRKLKAEWELQDEPILAKILSSKTVDHATVIVAPIKQLSDRASKRRVAEPNTSDPGKYPSGLWSKIIGKLDFFAIYERLFDLLEEVGIPFDVLYSSEEFGICLPSDRTYVHHNLRGRFLSIPSIGDIDSVVGLPGAEYQTVILPRGRTTAKKAAPHLGGSRSATFSQFRSMTFQNRSVLDIGCALGDMLFRAERHGATKLVGVELMNKRFEAAQAITKLLQSNVKIVNSDFMTNPLEQQFDDVLALNVIHHVSDVRGFLKKAASLAKHRLIVEYPNLKDPKFQQLGAITEDLAHLPIIGVSSSRVDQTFVYTLPALERMIAEAGKFTVQSISSPIPSRSMAIFHRA